MSMSESLFAYERSQCPVYRQFASQQAYFIDPLCTLYQVIIEVDRGFELAHLGSSASGGLWSAFGSEASCWVFGGSGRFRSASLLRQFLIKRGYGYVWVSALSGHGSGLVAVGLGFSIPSPFRPSVFSGLRGFGGCQVLLFPF